MATLAPTPEQFKAFTELPDEGPIVMVNLLKFKPDGGRESYRIYGEKFAEMMQSVRTPSETFPLVPLDAPPKAPKKKSGRNRIPLSSGIASITSTALPLVQQ